MPQKLLLSFAGLAICAATQAAANTTSVNCPGYVIAVSDDVAIQGEALAGSVREFERIVCERSAEDGAAAEEVISFPVFVEELGVSTRVVIFPMRISDN